jgi:Cytochrome P460
MKRIVFALVAVGALANMVADMAPASGQADGEAAPIFGIKIPPGFRDWRLISVNHLAGSNLKQVRAQLGNDIAITAFREGKLPFPDGTIIAALHWNEALSEENNKVLATGFPGSGLQSSVAESAQNVQFMVKDSKKYAATGGWGFADFKNGKPGNEACTKPVSPATSLPKIATTSSPDTRRRLRHRDGRRDVFHWRAIGSQCNFSNPGNGSAFYRLDADFQ